MSEHVESVEISHCRSCGAEITWAQTRAGKLAPFDVEYDEQETPLQGGSHFASCPDSKSWRTKGTK